MYTNVVFKKVCRFEMASKEEMGQDEECPNYPKICMRRRCLISGCCCDFVRGVLIAMMHGKCESTSRQWVFGLLNVA
jgi:hypothetical protein